MSLIPSHCLEESVPQLAHLSQLHPVPHPPRLPPGPWAVLPERSSGARTRPARMSPAVRMATAASGLHSRRNNWLVVME